MFPSLRTRLLITIAAIAGSMLWVSAANAALAPDGSGGISLLTASSTGVAVSMILLAGLPALIMGLLISAFGNPLAGLFTAGICLCSLAVAGGTMDQWLKRNGASLPGDYMKLAIETVAWFAAVIGFMCIAMTTRPRIRKTIPQLSDKYHFGQETRLRRIDKSSWTAGGITVLVGGLLAFILLRTAESGQIVGGLILGFMIAAFTGNLVAGSLFGESVPIQKGSDKVERIVSPPKNPIPVLLSPAVVAIVGYLITLLTHSDQTALMDHWYEGGVIGLARALPIHYASAGVIGCCLGIGWAQAVAGGATGPEEDQTAETSSASETPA